MAKVILPLIFVLVSAGLFFGYIDPTYQAIGELQNHNERLDAALTKSRELQAVRDQLLSRYNTFSAEDMSRLLKMLPDNIDNIRLILDIDNIATAYGLIIYDFGINTGQGGPAAGEGEGGSQQVQQQQQAANVLPQSSRFYETVLLEFSVDAEYEDFLSFLRDLEKSLRLVDILSVNLEATSDLVYTYNVTIRTYWLK